MASLRILRWPRAVSVRRCPGNVAFKELSEWQSICIQMIVRFWRGDFKMLNWAVTFFIVALIAAVLGFTGVAVAAAGIAKICFVVFLVLFLVSLIAHTTRRV
jgi:uncharacterized membrane protein YtjA (UPF0391 family)